MGGLIGQPPSESGSPPTVPVPDFVSIAKATAAGQSAAGWFDQFMRALWEHVAPGVQVAVSTFTSVADDIFATGLAAIGKFQGTNTPGFFTTIATALTDLLGIEFDSGSIQNAYRQGGTLGANINIGSKFLTMLAKEMSPTRDTPVGPGWQGACAFMGYGIAFGVREGNLSMLVEALPPELRILEGLREYGVNVAQSLGLGRLARLVMAPLMKILVADPLTYELNAQYRPTILPEAMLFRTYWRSLIDQPTLEAGLAALGHSPSNILALEADTAVQPSIAQDIARNRTGQIDDLILSRRLLDQGITTASIGDYKNGVEALRAESHLNAAVATYLQLFKNRWIDEQTMVSKLQAWGLGQNEVGWLVAEGEATRGNVQHELSLAEIQTGYELGLVDLTYLDEWATRWGYSAPDRVLLQYLTLAKADKAAAALELAKYKLRMTCLAAKKAGRPLPPGFDGNCNPT